MHMNLVVEVVRGSIRESRHLLEAAVCDAAGRRVAGTENPDRVTTFRSAAKPFQLLPLVERGHAERWGFRDEEVAVMTASHTGSAEHLRLVRGILDRLGLGPEHLVCGYHEPLDRDSLAAVRAEPERRSSLYNNCSGKHAGMLALAVSEKWPVAGYERPDHPVQRLIRQTLAETCGVDAESLQTGTDDCGVVVFAAPLAVMAQGYARLASAMADGDPRERALHRIRTAMTSHPQAVGGAGRFSTALMEKSRGRIVAKGGAEGLECLGIPGRGLGLAVKCLDGATRPMAPAVIAVLQQLGELTEGDLERLGELRRPVLRNHRGDAVGVVEASVEILSESRGL